jgi:LysM repeat protein
MKNSLHLLFFLFLFIIFSSQASVLDSLGVEKKNGKTFIKHKIDPKETIYALSRKYGVTVAEIKEANPGVDFASLNIGDIVYVPSKNTSEKTTAAKPSEPVKQEAPVKSQNAAAGKTHKVQPKETLFALAKKYDLSVDELKKANPELDKGLQVGMILEIPQKGVAQSTGAKSGKPEKLDVEDGPAKPQFKDDAPVKREEPKKDDVVKKEEPKKTEQSAPKAEPVAVKAEAKPEAAPVKRTSVPAEIPASNSKIEKIKESGMAEAAPSRSEGPDFYALHKTAPVGTIIQVINEENNQTAFVRVVGTSNSAAIIQLSPKTLQRLNVKGDKVKVVLSYFKP